MLSPFLADDEGGLMLDTDSLAADAEMDTAKLPEAMPSQQLPSQQQQQPPPMASFFGGITQRASLDRAAQHAVRMKKPNYSEPVVAWNEEDKHTGLVKYGVNHYESESASLVNKIPCPTRPPVIFLDHDMPEQDEADSPNLEMAADPLQLV